MPTLSNRRIARAPMALSAASRLEAEIPGPESDENLARDVGGRGRGCLLADEGSDGCRESQRENARDREGAKERQRAHIKPRGRCAIIAESRVIEVDVFASRAQQYRPGGIIDRPGDGTNVRPLRACELAGFRRAAPDDRPLVA